jgi:hypothetical protein
MEKSLEGSKKKPQGSKKKPHRVVTCGACGGLFQANRPWQRFCDKSCKEFHRKEERNLAKDLLRIC